MTIDFRPHAEKIREFFNNVFGDVNVEVKRHSIELDECVRLELVTNNGFTNWYVSDNTDTGWEACIDRPIDELEWAFDDACERLAVSRANTFYSLDFDFGPVREEAAE